MEKQKLYKNYRADDAIRTGYYVINYANYSIFS
jgi:hypothetical protein